MMIDLAAGEWINKPSDFRMTDESVEIITDPGTDFWQRSYYGFRNDNAPALLFSSSENFSFTTRVSFQYQHQFDQCGLIIYKDSENWFKASIEYENNDFSRLGSVSHKLGLFRLGHQRYPPALRNMVPPEPAGT